MKKILSFLAIAMIMMGLSACSGGGGAADTPDEAVKNAINGLRSAMKSGDVKALAEACCESDGSPVDISSVNIEDVKHIESKITSGFEYTIDDTQIKKDGISAKVRVTLIINGERDPENIRCTKGSDGKWRVNINSIL